MAPDPADAESIWRALADPTRREILDLLRRGPMTTGDIADRFAQTRFGIMKHLGVLTAAGLVVVQREGRRRWNHLNPVPIHDVYRRWVTPFEAPAIGRLERLKQHAERAAEEEGMTTAALSTLDIVLEVPIKAPREVVWRSLVDDIGEWWPKQFYVGTSPKRFRLEPKVGGLVWEDWGDGEGVVFGQVLTFQRNTRVQWAGDMSAEFGGPARSVTTFTLAESERGTTLTFRDTPFGALSEMALKGLAEGWKFLLEGCFRPYVETGAVPERPATLEA